MAQQSRGSLRDTAVKVVAAAGTVASAALLGYRSVWLLGDDEQLRVQHFTGMAVYNGPGLKLLNPTGYRRAEVIKAETIPAASYVCVRDLVSGEERIERGPQLLFLGPQDQVHRRGEATSLTASDYVVVVDTLSGEKRVERGPCVWFPKPHEEFTVGASIGLHKTEYLIVEDQLTGVQSMVKGPCIWTPGPYESASAKKTAISLQDLEYMRLRDTSAGQRWVQRGKPLIYLEPTWEVEDLGKNGTGIFQAWVLKADEYIKVLDKSTGKLTVHRGEATVFPGIDDILLHNGVQKAVKIDGEHAALVRDNSTGQLRLVSERQLFVPGPNDTIEQVRDLIKLAEHEAMIIKDGDGVFHYYYGDPKRANGQPTSFFLPPHAEVQQIYWSRGPRRGRKDVSFERFDMRPHFMKFEFNCRTSDNVELVLEGVLFWEVVDLPAMYRRTGDTSGDMVYHLRSQFILHVSRLPLKAFMETLHAISNAVLEEDQEFYTTRGIKVYSLEVTRYQCAEKSTAGILEQIIQETTSRMNRLSQAESENEVSLFRTQGQVAQSQLNGELMAISRAQAQEEANSAGASEASRVAQFLTGLKDEVPALEDRIKMWQVLRKTEALQVVSQGDATVYFTPNDVDLSIESKHSS